MQSDITCTQCTHVTLSCILVDEGKTGKEKDTSTRTEEGQEKIGKIRESRQGLEIAIDSGIGLSVTTLILYQ